MSLRMICWGWDLDHNDVLSVAMEDDLPWPRANVILLSADAISRFWRRAVGDPVRSFRCDAHEHEAWQRVLGWQNYLRNHLADGGHLICRLDVPSSRCRVRSRPDDASFPCGTPIGPYDLLAPVDPLLGAIAPQLGILPRRETIDLTGAAHPLSDFVLQFQEHCLSGVVIRASKFDGAVKLAVTPVGETVALAGQHVAMLPALEGVSAAEEAAVLVRAIKQWVRPRGPSTDDPRSSQTYWFAAQRRQEIELDGEIRRLKRLKRQTQERMKAAEALGDSAYDSNEPMQAAIKRCLEVLGFDLARRESSPGVWLDDLPQLVGDLSQPEGRILHARLRSEGGWQRGLTFIDAALPSGHKIDLVTAERLHARTEGNRNVLIPMSQLSAAASMVLASPQGETWAARIRQSISTAEGIFRLDLSSLVVEPSERQLLS